MCINGPQPHQATAAVSRWWSCAASARTHTRASACTPHSHTTHTRLHSPLPPHTPHTTPYTLFPSLTHHGLRVCALRYLHASSLTRIALRTRRACCAHARNHAPLGHICAFGAHQVCARLNQNQAFEHLPHAIFWTKRGHAGLSGFDGHQTCAS